MALMVSVGAFLVTNTLALACVMLSFALHHCRMTSLYSFPFVMPAPESVADGMV